MTKKKIYLILSAEQLMKLSTMKLNDRIIIAHNGILKRNKYFHILTLFLTTKLSYPITLNYNDLSIQGFDSLSNFIDIYDLHGNEIVNYFTEEIYQELESYMILNGI